MTTPSTNPRTTPHQTWDRSLYRLGRGATIGIVAVIVVVLAGVGLLVGAVFARDAGSDHPGPEGARGGFGPFAFAPRGSSSPRAAAGVALGRGHGLFWTVPQVQPSPVPTTEPSPFGSPSVVPSGSPTDPGPTPSPSPGAELTVPIGPNGEVIVPVPEPWQILIQDVDRTMLQSGLGDWVFAIVGQTDPSADAGDVLAANFSVFISEDNYTDVVTYGIEPLEPFGAMVSWARMSYDATYFDSQASYPVIGNFYSAVRSDGLVLLFNPEIDDPADWDGHVPNWLDIYVRTHESFAAAPYPVA